MMNTKKITVIVLAVVSVILLVLIYKQEMPVKRITNSNSPSQGAGVSLPDFTNPDGTLNVEKQKSYLFSISISSSDEEKARHYQYATSIATPSEYLNITSCKNVDPLVLEAVDGEEITLKNDSDVDVTFALDETTSYVVNAKSTKLINVNFSRGIGLYGYGCQDLTSRGSGMILVTPKL